MPGDGRHAGPDLHEQPGFGRTGCWLGEQSLRIIDYHGEDPNNYNDHTVNGSWSITPAPVTMTAGSYTGVYDGNSHATRTAS